MEGEKPRALAWNGSPTPLDPVSLRAGPYTFSHVTYDPPSPGRRVETPESHFLRFDDKDRFTGIILMNPRAQLEREGAVYVSLPEGDRARVQGIESFVHARG
jgi:hypothetical protein